MQHLTGIAEHRCKDSYNYAVTMLEGLEPRFLELQQFYVSSDNVDGEITLQCQTSTYGVFCSIIDDPKGEESLLEINIFESTDKSTTLTDTLSTNDTKQAITFLNNHLEKIWSTPRCIDSIFNK